MEAFYTNNNNINCVSNEAIKTISRNFKNISKKDIVFLKEFTEANSDNTREIRELYIFINRNEHIEKHYYSYEFFQFNPMEQNYEYGGIIEPSHEAALLIRMKKLNGIFVNDMKD